MKGGQRNGKVLRAEDEIKTHCMKLKEPRRNCKNYKTRKLYNAKHGIFDSPFKA